MRRLLILASCLFAAMLALYSCSMRAAMTTDSDGRIVGVSSIRLESSLSRVAVAMLVAGGELGVQLRWLRSFSVAGTPGNGSVSAHVVACPDAPVITSATYDADADAVALDFELGDPR